MTQSTGRLHQLGLKYGTDKATHHQYTDFYEEHLPAEVDRLLEIGVMDGASLRMWREFYPGATDIVGVDLVERAPVDGCIVLQGDATDWNVLSDLRWAGAVGGQFDIIIDDGSHMTQDQQTTFEYAYQVLLKPGGVYVMEDLHTSFMPNYVNSAENTYDWLARQHFTTELDVVFWNRLGDDLTDSVTAIIRKPA